MEEPRAGRPEVEPTLASRTTFSQGDAFCSRCGSPRQQAVLVCRCGQASVDAEVVVDGERLVGTSPMVLPERCIKCDAKAADGHRYEKTLYWYPRWVPFTVFLGLLPYVIIAHAMRKALPISYSRCAECRDSRLKKGMLAGVAWAGCLVFLVAGAYYGKVWCAWVGLSLLVVALALTVWASWNLRIVRFSEPLFTVKGFGDEFLASMRRSSGQW